MKIGNFIKIETPGDISFDDDKLRVSTSNSITSILFEDISSLSVRYSSGINMKYLILGLLSVILGPQLISSIFSSIKCGPSINALFMPTAVPLNGVLPAGYSVVKLFQYNTKVSPTALPLYCCVPARINR